MLEEMVKKFTIGKQLAYHCTEENNYYCVCNHHCIDWIQCDPRVCELHVLKEIQSDIMSTVIYVKVITFKYICVIERGTHACLKAKAMETAPLISPAHHMIICIKRTSSQKQMIMNHS